MNDGKAKIVLRDGREVWRCVSVRYREVKTGKYISDREVESLLDIRLSPDNPYNQDPLKQEIVAAQARLAVDLDTGSKGTSATRVVIQILESMEKSSLDLKGKYPTFILGRDLAFKLLALLATSVK
jgi:hypothetical protein